LPPAAERGPTRIIIKSAGIDTSVVPVGWSILEQNGTSAFPGQPGNTVLAGHNNVKGEVFRYLVDVQ
jgi:sortase (surface protein transpeptidase)